MCFTVPSMAEAYDSLQEVVTGLQGFLEEADSGLPFDGYERVRARVLSLARQ